MSDLDKGVDDLAAELDAQVLGDFGWYPEGTEIQNAGAGGSGFAALSMITPALELLKKEDEESPISREEWEKELVRETRLRTFEMLLRELLPNPRRLDPTDIGLNVIVWMWDLQIPPLDGMTLEQIGNLVGQTRAAICERHKRICQRKKEKVGQKGTHNPRQKKAGIIGTYAASAKGNNNRALAAAKERSEAAFGLSKREMNE